MTRRMTLAEKFAKRYTAAPSGCWLWNGRKRGDKGYGAFSFGKRGLVEYAHRASWRLHRGPIPDGLLVCHHCDVRACVNPDHLFLGTHRDNMRDCANKGRTHRGDHRGESNQNVKLSIDQVHAIRTTDVNCAELARQYGVSKQAVWRIRVRKSWRHV